MNIITYRLDKNKRATNKPIIIFDDNRFYYYNKKGKVFDITQIVLDLRDSKIEFSQVLKPVRKSTAPFIDPSGKLTSFNIAQVIGLYLNFGYTLDLEVEKDESKET